MHGEFGRGRVATLNFSAVEIGDDQIIRRHHAFAKSLGSGEDALGIQTNGNISVTRGNKSAFVEPVSGRADVVTVFGHRLVMAGRNVIGAHSNFWANLEVPSSTSRAADAFQPGVR